jgi:hypothetical protein
MSSHRQQAVPVAMCQDANSHVGGRQQISMMRY